MSAAVRGTTPQRTIVSHRDLANDLSDAEPGVAEPGDDDNDNISIKPAEPDTDTAENPGSTSPADPTSAAKPKPKSKSATPKAAAVATAKPAKSTTTVKAPKAPKAAKTDTKSKTTWAGETGPDNAVTVDGEQQWEISDIVGQEGDMLLVKWKGWKGIWEEDHAVIAESAPEMVKTWEDKVERLAKEKAAGGKKRGPKKGTSTASGAVAGKGKAMTARKAASKTAGGKGRPKKVVETKKKGAKVTRSPKKATATASPKKTAVKVKAKTAMGTAGKKRGRPAKAK
jgi:hypothetical protein